MHFIMLRLIYCQRQEHFYFILGVFYFEDLTLLSMYRLPNSTIVRLRLG